MTGPISSPALAPRGHGPHDPTRSTPVRAPGSIRRTTTIDLVRPTGPGGELVVIGRGRDLATDPRGTSTVVAEAEVHVRVAANGRLCEISTEPAVAAVEHLLGVSVGPGFRGRVDAAVGGSLLGSPLYLLLDDLPIFALVSGYGEMARHSSIPFDATIAARMVDLCAGWQAGATMMEEVDATGRLPTPFGPPAPDLGRDDDPMAWHPLPDLHPGAMRRRRRLDVTAADPLVVAAMFRDSHVDDSGSETVLHEYEVDATVDERSGRVASMSTTPRVLPWPECPAAAASAQRIIGIGVDELRPFVRTHLTGVSTCTHLNDALRSLADVAALAPHLPA